MFVHTRICYSGSVCRLGNVFFRWLLPVGLVGILFLFPSCNKNNLDDLATQYPKDIAKIIRKNCATSGCHNAASHQAAGGLNMESWTDLFEGSRGGSPVIPYAPAQSYLLYTINTDTALGPVFSPTMPYGEEPLSNEEYAKIWNWVFDGARNANGEERFPPDAGRKKYYIGHQVCDNVAVIDAESRQIMRYIDVGMDPVGIEYVFDIQVTPDGSEWWVVFFGANDHISRFSTLTDEKIGDIHLGEYGWSTLTFTPDGKFGIVTGEYLSRMRVIELTTGAPIGPVKSFNYSTRGARVHPNRQEIYLAEYQDASLLVLAYDANGNLGTERQVDLVQGVPPAIAGDVWPFEIQFAPDGSKYFITCTHSQEIRVLDGQTDSLLAVIPMAHVPSKMAWSSVQNKLFVACMDDQNSWSGDPTKRGAVFSVDPQNYQVSSPIYSGYQPYSMVADDVNGVLVVTNRNADVNGPAPHHVSECEGRNGYITLIDMASLEVIDEYKPEILADPATIAIK